jgi:Flp pilus assembly pilin Flp
VGSCSIALHAVDQMEECAVLDALVTLVVLIGGSLALFGLDALDGPLHVALVLLPGLFWGPPATDMGDTGVEFTALAGLITI